MNYIFKQLPPAFGRLLTPVLILHFFTAGCDRGPNTRSKLLKVLDLTLNVEMIDTVRQGEAALSWSDFRGKYRNI